MSETKIGLKEEPLISDREAHDLWRKIYWEKRSINTRRFSNRAQQLLHDNPSRLSPVVRTLLDSPLLPYELHIPRNEVRIDPVVVMVGADQTDPRPSQVRESILQLEDTDLSNHTVLVEGYFGESQVMDKTRSAYLRHLHTAFDSAGIVPRGFDPHLLLAQRAKGLEHIAKGRTSEEKMQGRKDQVYAQVQQEDYHILPSIKAQLEKGKHVLHFLDLDHVASRRFAEKLVEEKIAYVSFVPDYNLEN